MQQFIHKKPAAVIAALLFTVLLGTVGILHYVKADSSAVELSNIDYDNMELTISTNGNAIVYYSTNKTKWYEADGAAGTDDSGNGTLTYDISWISASGNTTLYFRGNTTTTTLAVTIPGYNKSFKVAFDKVDGTFDFQNTEGAEIVRWRKTTDYTWHYVWAERGKSEITITTGDANYVKYGITGTIQTLEDFEKEVSDLRVKGAKLIFQTAPIAWSKDSQGARPSKDVKVTVAAKKAAPSMKVNVKKMTVNTNTKIEWTTAGPKAADADWKNCTKSNMSLADLAPEAVAGTKDVTLYFRTAATSSNCESKVMALLIPAREAAPSSPVAIAQTAGSAAGKGKAVLTFSNVPSTGYEYTIVKSGSLTDETKVSWKKITKAKAVKFSEKNLPAGAKIYIRNAGVALNVNKGIDLKLPSKYLEMTVPAYPAAESGSTGTSK